MEKNSYKDLSLFLLAISEDSPAGESIRYDDSYRQLQEMRNISPGEAVDYFAIEQSCENILTHVSKDLHVAAILTESWVHLYGLQGLAWGLELILGLSKKFWNTVYPNNPDDWEVRLGAFTWINDKLSDAMLHIPLTKPKMAGFSPYTLADLVDAHQHDLNIQKAGLRKNDLIEFAQKHSKPTLDLIYKSMLLTPEKVYEEFLQHANKCERYIKEIESLLEENFKENAITLSGFDNYLQQIQSYLDDAIYQLSNKNKLVQNDVMESPLITEAESVDIDLGKMSPEEVYTLLSDVADHLEKSDPKSLAPKLIRKAIKWGNMGSSEFLQELADEDISLPELTKILN